MANLNDTVILDRTAIWNVDANETAEEFETRIVDSIEGRTDTLRLAVFALED